MKRLLVITMVVILSSSIARAQDLCKGDFNYNGSVASEDVTIFLEHFGRNPFNNPCPPDGPTPVPKTGQTTSYATGDDGDLERGAALVTPRFTDNLDGTVTDSCTGLMWQWDTADTNGDGQIGLSDLATLLAHYGTTSGASYEDGDLDLDGDVDLSDLAALLGHYGEGT